jgi:Arm DNA-binding domain
MPLSDATVRGAKPATAPRKLSDGGGLFLLVTPKPAGSKLWRLAYRFGGKQKALALGIYPSISLLQARSARDEAKKLLARGIDPSVQRRTERLTQKAVVNDSFRAVAEELVASWNAKVGRM